MGEGAERGKTISPDEIQKAAREKWLKYREQQLEPGKGKGKDAEHTPERERAKDKSKKHTPDDDFSL